MNIQRTAFSSPLARPQTSAPQAQAQEAAPSTPEDSVTFVSSDTLNSVKAAAVLGGIGLVGAAVGAASGNYSGVLAGLGGAVVGASAGASTAVLLPGEKIGTGTLLGAVGGAIAASSFSGPYAAVALGLAGASIPFGAIVGLAAGMGSE